MAAVAVAVKIEGILHALLPPTDCVKADVDVDVDVDNESNQRHVAVVGILFLAKILLLLLLKKYDSIFM